MSNQLPAYSHSHLFTVRLWAEDTGSTGSQMRGEVRHVLGDGIRYFQEWETLVSYLAEKMHELKEKAKGGDETTSHIGI